MQRHIRGSKENTKFIYDGQDVLFDDNSGVLTKYLNGAGIDNKLRIQTGSDVKYFLADHLGSTNGLADSSGNLSASTSYDSFGNTTNANFLTRYQFTGREFDNFIGLHYYRARFYGLNHGRFISEDPIGFLVQILFSCTIRSVQGINYIAETFFARACTNRRNLLKRKNLPWTLL